LYRMKKGRGNPNSQNISFRKKRQVTKEGTKPGKNINSPSRPEGGPRRGPRNRAPGAGFRKGSNPRPPTTIKKADILALGQG